MALKMPIQTTIIAISCLIAIGINLCKATCDYENIFQASITSDDTVLVQCSAFEQSLPDDVTVLCAFIAYGNVSLANKDDNNITDYIDFSHIYLESKNTSYISITLKSSLDDIGDVLTSMDGILNCGSEPEDNFTLLISPANDHQPVFDEIQYKIENVTEVFPPGYDLLAIYGLEIYAHDDDTPGDASSAMDFSIIAGNENQAFQFQKDPNSCDSKKCVGQLFLLKTIDYRDSAQYVLTLQVMDESDAPKRSMANLTLVIQDFDNLDPIFQYNFYSSTVNQITGDTYSLPMSPDSIFAFDQDSGINATVTYEMIVDDCGTSCNATRDAFSIDPTDGTINFDSSVDIYVIDNQLATFQIKATQVDNPDHTAIATVSVSLPSPTTPLPTTTLRPVAVGNTSQTLYLSILTPINTMILKVEANDARQYTYSLNGKNNYFAINSEDGSIYVKDYLDVGLYELAVTATLNDDPKVADVAQVNINVVDDEESSPVVNQNYHEFYIPENDDDFPVLLVDLSSEYEDHNNDSYYFIAQSLPETCQDWFSINHEFGAVELIQTLDYENQSSCDIIIEVDFNTSIGDNDMLSSSLSSPKESNETLNYNQFLIRVNVGDVNDEPPEFYGLGVANNQLSVGISSQVSNGQQVVQLQTSDADTDPQNTIVYYKLDDDNFYVDKNSGLLLSSKSLSALDQSKYQLAVTATNDANSFLNQQTLDVIIYTLENSEILVIASNYSINFLENNYENILGTLSIAIDCNVRSLKWVTNDQHNAVAYLYALGTDGPLSKDELNTLLANDQNAFSNNGFDAKTATTFDETDEAHPQTTTTTDNTAYIIAVSVLAAALFICLIVGGIYAWKFHKKDKPMESYI